jgi:DNA invertase Pin-like site-specific DNA recombinase
MRPSRNYGYIRVSTILQELSPEAQRANMSRMAAAEGKKIDTWVEDPAVSAKIRFDKRDGGGEIVRMAQKGDTVWIAKLDRAFRNLSDCALMLDAWERKGIGIRIVDINGQFDITTPQGKAFVQMLAIFAELERKLISVRTREGLAICKAKGQSNGRYAGYGFKWRRVWSEDKQKFVKHRISNPDERAIMREIVKWKLDGHDFESIYHNLRKHKVKTTEGNEWSLDRVKRAYQAELKLQLDESPGGPR